MDRDAFMAAFERLVPRLTAPPYKLAKTGDRYMAIPFIRERKYGELPATLDELIEDNLDDDAIANFVTLLVAREMGGKAKKHREAGDLHLKWKRGTPRFRYFDGDLVVRGNFGYELCVLVRGDLIVDGVIEDRVEASPLLVGGNVRAAGMYLGSQTKIGGSLAVSDVLHLRFTRGGDTLFVGRGATTKLYVFTPDDSKLTGELAATYRIEAYPDDLGMLASHLDPALAKQLAKKLELTQIIKALRDGTPIWR